MTLTQCHTDFVTANRETENSCFIDFERANGAYRDFTIKTPRLFSHCLTLTKKLKILFAKYREWWPSQIRRHDAALFFVLLDAYKKVEIHFCKISRKVAIANLPS